VSGASVASAGGTTVVTSSGKCIVYRR
jgi:hypothetical protein